MPVDKFGRMDDVKSNGEGASLTYIDNNFLRKDGTTDITGSINMNGNTLTRVSNPVNPQDVATKNYVDSSVGLLDENGGYHMTGYLNMGFNKIKNLFDPTRPNEAATKNYVDTTVLAATTGEKALTKNPDGSFSMDGEIDMKGNRIKNLPEPAAWDDPVKRSFLSTQMLSVLNQIALERKFIISVHAEEQGSLENGSYEFSFGNGGSGRTHALGGYCMSAPGIIRGSLLVLKGHRFLEEEVKINIVVNGVEKLDYSLIKKRDECCSCIVFPQPLEVKQCDVINFITRSDNPDIQKSLI